MPETHPIATAPEPPAAAAATVEAPPRERVLDLFRRWGYLETELDPLGRDEPRRHPELALDPALPGVEEGRRWYCGTVGVELAHIPDPERRRWLADAMERDAEPEDAERVFEQVLRAETFEQVLQGRYLGTKRFSIEGIAALVPLLREMLDACAERGARQAVMAMSHRGRLNVMAHVVGTSVEALLAGFEDVDPRSVLGGGDVKYHQGATGRFRARNGEEVQVHLASNPSHLEAIDPVALGRVRAKQQRLRLAGEPAAEKRVVPILLHGDAAFAGQGILAETLNLASLDGFAVGGTLHVVVNNRIGFTTEPHALHSGAFATDVARRLPIPIFHVNGEDLRQAMRVARLAVEYRDRFGDDVVIDLVGYRRHGHSEVDDPTVTQPLLYKAIDAHPPLADLYGERVGLTPDEIDQRRHAIRDEIDAAQKAAVSMEKKPRLAQLPSYWDPFHGGPHETADEIDTGVPAEELGRVAALLTRAPEGFHVHPKIQKLLEQRAEMGRGERPVDYGFSEALAFGTLLAAGVPVRLSGQDTRRGTFSHRHAALIDVEDEREHLPLRAFAEAAPGGGFFEIYDSMLSEAAVLGFEFGFARDYPEALVAWEAQFGDFVNGAQVIIDQFVSAAEDKWKLLSGVVMLLPHGYEGQGPEHSSARVERFLTLAAECNMQVCQPSTAGQYFHLLRRQALRKWRKPLVVFTPKSMLRHKTSSSALADLSRPRFLEVVPDASVEDAQRVLVATGKIGHELEAERTRRGDERTAIVFLEQLHPFPDAELAAALDAHPDAKHIVWVQEEPANMGAHAYVMPHLERHARGRKLRSVKRSASASPATGSAKAHLLEQKTLLTLAFEIR